MRGILILTISMLCHFSLIGQNGSIRENLNFENYTRQEIRTYLMMIEPEDSKVYELARYSKANHNWSYIFYGLSAASFVGALDRFQVAERSSNNTIMGRDEQRYLAQALLFASVVELGLGIWNSHRSRSRLKNALKLYHNQ